MRKPEAAPRIEDTLKICYTDYMKRGVIILLSLVLFISLLTVSDSSAGAVRLRTKPANPSEIKGLFTVILYGSRHSSDIETIAFLDVEGDQYTLEPYAPAFDYKTEKNLPAKEALSRAEKFVGWHRSFFQTELRKIADDKGNTIGYEVRPLYNSLDFGVSDVLYVDYRLKGNNVKIRIRLLPSVERQLFDNDSFPSKR